jgi:hypothetical protein
LALSTQSNGWRTPAPVDRVFVVECLRQTCFVEKLPSMTPQLGYDSDHLISGEPGDDGM